MFPPDTDLSRPRETSCWEKVRPTVDRPWSMDAVEAQIGGSGRCLGHECAKQGLTASGTEKRKPTKRNKRSDDKEETGLIDLQHGATKRIL